MPSITKSSTRLAWALSLLGLDRLAAFFSSATPWDHPEDGEAARTTSTLDDLTHRVREMLSPTLQSMVDVGDRILDRLFGSLDELDKEQDLPWPFPAHSGSASNPYPVDSPIESPHPSDPHPERMGFQPAVEPPSPGPVSGHKHGHGHGQVIQPGEWAPVSDVPDIGDFVTPGGPEGDSR